MEDLKSLMTWSELIESCLVTLRPVGDSNKYVVLLKLEVGSDSCVYFDKNYQNGSRNRYIQFVHLFVLRKHIPTSLDQRSA